MKKLVLVCLSSLLALGSLGIAYSQSADTLRVRGVVPTESGNIGICDLGVLDAGPDPAQSPGQNPQGRDVATHISTNSTEVGVLNGVHFFKSVNEDITNAYPWYRTEATILMANLSAVPATVSNITFQVNEGSPNPALLDFLVVSHWKLMGSNFPPSGLDGGTLEDLRSALDDRQIESGQIITLALEFYFAEDIDGPSGTIRTLPQGADVSFTIIITATQGDDELPPTPTPVVNIPFVKVKWEQEPIANLESGDPTHLIPGTQILPPLVHLATKPIQYYAVVSDEEEMGNVTGVFSYVFHPDGSPAPYNADVAPGGAYFKYQVIFTKLGHDAAAKAAVVTANNANLTTFGPVPADYQTKIGHNGTFVIGDITNAEGTGELDKGTADLWMGQEVIDFEQPAGDYRVDVYAVDHNNNVSLPLHNTFNYVPLCGIEIDFPAVNYGEVDLNTEKTIDGDLSWYPAVPSGIPATVRNIGNTWAHVTVAQDDMAFGKAGALPGTAYQGSVPPTGTQSNWNVYFDARMGNDPANERWYDPTAAGQPMTNVVMLPNYLGLSSMDELDFSINVKNGNGVHSGLMIIGCEIEPFSATGTPGGIPSH